MKTKSRSLAWSCDLAENHFNTWRTICTPDVANGGLWDVQHRLTSSSCYLSVIICDKVSAEILPRTQSKNKLLFKKKISCFVVTSHVFASTAAEKLWHLPRPLCLFSKKETSWHWQATGGEGHSSLFPLNPCDFCSKCQMVWFSAHMVAFFRDHSSWPVWHKKKERKRKARMMRC